MSVTLLSCGDYWFSLLTKQSTPCMKLCPSVRAADGEIEGQKARFIAVVPDKNNLYPRARKGEVGLLEGWTLAKVVRDVIEQDKDQKDKRVIIAIIDVASQAYGRREEAFAIHQSLAGAASAYADARLSGHPIIGLIVGKAMSGAFLAHGYQANRLIAFDDPSVMIHAMGKDAAARITLRSVEALEKLSETIPPMAYDIENYEKLGLLYKLLKIENIEKPSNDEISLVKATICDAIKDVLANGIYLESRLHAKDRHASLLVRERMRSEW